MSTNSIPDIKYTYMEVIEKTIQEAAPLQSAAVLQQLKQRWIENLLKRLNAPKNFFVPKTVPAKPVISTPKPKRLHVESEKPPQKDVSPIQSRTEIPSESREASEDRVDDNAQQNVDSDEEGWESWEAAGLPSDVNESPVNNEPESISHQVFPVENESTNNLTEPVHETPTENAPTTETSQLLSNIINLPSELPSKIKNVNPGENLDSDYTNLDTENFSSYMDDEFFTFPQNVNSEFADQKPASTSFVGQTETPAPYKFEERGRGPQGRGVLVESEKDLYGDEEVIDDSDLSDLDDAEPECSDLIVAQFESVQRPHKRKIYQKNLWHIKLRHGIIQINGQEYIFNSLLGNLSF